MKKERRSKKNIFSPKNLLIIFVGLVVLLLAFNYFYPVFSNDKNSVNENSNVGELHSITGQGLFTCPQGKILKWVIRGSATYATCESPCATKQWYWDPYRHKMLRQGRCIDEVFYPCPSCGSCEHCNSNSGDLACIPDNVGDNCRIFWYIHGKCTYPYNDYTGILECRYLGL